MERGSYDEYGYYVSRSVKVHKVYRELLAMEDKYGTYEVYAAVTRFLHHQAEAQGSEVESDGDKGV